MPKIILATRNREKVAEIRAILGNLPLDLECAGDHPGLPDVVEDGRTLEENALKKAAAIFRASGIPALADDTGLEVFHLGMRPGVISARYAGEGVTYADNNRKLLRELDGVSRERRKARFRCVAVFVGDGVQHMSEGICHGVILGEPRGSGGFGYDPLFLPDGYSQTFGELPPEVKNQISHRAKAFGRMGFFLKEFFGLA